MIGLRKISTFFLAGSILLAMGACGQKKESSVIPRDPQVALTCIGVMPVVISAEVTAEESLRDAKELKDGVKTFNVILQDAFRNRKDIRFVSKAQLDAMEDAGGADLLSRARRAGSYLSCNGVLEMTLWRYKDRIGGAYTAKEPASVSFTYRLVDVNSGNMLCQGRFDEEQQSVMENLYNFGRARSRGFTWITADELLREGVMSKLEECSYLQPDE